MDIQEELEDLLLSFQSNAKHYEYIASGLERDTDLARWKGQSEAYGEAAEAVKDLLSRLNRPSQPTDTAMLGWDTDEQDAPNTYWDVYQYEPMLKHTFFSYKPVLRDVDLSSAIHRAEEIATTKMGAYWGWRIHPRSEEGRKTKTGVLMLSPDHKLAPATEADIIIRPAHPKKNK